MHEQQGNHIDPLDKWDLPEGEKTWSLAPRKTIFEVEALENREKVRHVQEQEDLARSRIRENDDHIVEEQVQAHEQFKEELAFGIEPVMANGNSYLESTYAALDADFEARKHGERTSVADQPNDIYATNAEVTVV